MKCLREKKGDVEHKVGIDVIARLMGEAFEPCAGALTAINSWSPN
jgi:hypothetical protein